MPTTPQRELRNHTAEVLRRAERGERLTITVHGHPVAELVPLARARRFVPIAAIVEDLKGLLSPDDRLDEELRGSKQGSPEDPFDRYAEVMAERGDAGAP